MQSQAVSLKKPWISVPKKSVIIKISLIFNNLWKSVIICGQRVRPQINTDWHRLMTLSTVILFVPLGKATETFAEGSGGLETEVLLKRCGVGIGDGNIARLHGD